MTNLKALRRRITTPIPATAKGAQGTPLHSLARQPCATNAATGAIGFTHVNGSRFVSAALRREGLAPPLQYNLNINSRRGAAPRLCLSKKSLWTFLTSCFKNCKINFCSIILQFCRCGGLFNAKGNPDGFLSHFPSLRDLRLGRFFGSLKRTGQSDLPAFSYVLCLLLRHCGRSDQSCRTAASSFPAHACSGACGFLRCGNRSKRIEFCNRME